MSKPTKENEISALEAATNLINFLADPLDDWVEHTDEELAHMMAEAHFNFATAKKQLEARLATSEKLSVLKTARAKLDAAKGSMGTIGKSIQSGREAILAEIQGVRARLEGRGLAYTFRDFSDQPDQDLSAYLDDLKTLEKNLDGSGG